MKAEQNSFSERELDALIDGALAGFAGEPRAGLENRTLAKLRARERSPFFRRRWMMAAAVAAMIAAVAVGVQIHRDRQMIAQQAPATGQTPYNSVPSIGKAEVPGPSTSAMRGPATRSHARNSKAVGQWAKLERPAAQFPMPTPLTRQELLLVRLATLAQKNSGTRVQQPPSAEVNLTSLADAIVIKPLNIAPLEPAAETPGDSGPQR